jgi:hypothetical protein
MNFDKIENAEIDVIYGSKDGDSQTAGCTRQQFTIASSGASLASGVSSLQNCSFALLACFVKSDTNISSGVSIIFCHKGGQSYWQELDFINMDSEDFMHLN